MQSSGTCQNKVPTLIVFGEHDWIKPNSDTLPDVMANLTMEIIPGEDYSSVMASKTFKELILTFIESN